MRLEAPPIRHLAHVRGPRLSFRRAFSSRPRTLSQYSSKRHDHASSARASTTDARDPSDSSSAAAAACRARVAASRDIDDANSAIIHDVGSRARTRPPPRRAGASTRTRGLGEPTDGRRRRRRRPRRVVRDAREESRRLPIARGSRGAEPPSRRRGSREVRAGAGAAAAAAAAASAASPRAAAALGGTPPPRCGRPRRRPPGTARRRRRRPLDRRRCACRPTRTRSRCPRGRRTPCAARATPPRRGPCPCSRRRLLRGPRGGETGRPGGAPAAGGAGWSLRRGVARRRRRLG